MKATYRAFVLLTFMGLASCFSGSREETFLGKLKLSTLEGAPISSDRFDNKILILNLWATWCGPCIQEMPDLEEMQKELSNDFVLVLASDEESGRIDRFLRNTSHELEFVRISNSLESLGVYSLPTTFIIGKDGELLDTLVGARKWNTTEQLQTFENYLK